MNSDSPPLHTLFIFFLFLGKNENNIDYHNSSESINTLTQ